MLSNSSLPFKKIDYKLCINFGSTLLILLANTLGIILYMHPTNDIVLNPSSPIGFSILGTGVMNEALHPLDIYP